MPGANNSAAEREQHPDPIVKLRGSIISKTPYELLGDNLEKVSSLEKSKFIKFGDTKFDKNISTNYYHGTSTADNYNLCSLIFFWENRETGYYAYLKAAQSAKIGAVSFTYKTDLLDYLSGKKESSAHIKSKEDVEKDGHGTGKDELLINEALYKRISKKERVLLNNNTIVLGNKTFNNVLEIADLVFKSLPENLPEKDALNSTNKQKRSGDIPEFGNSVVKKTRPTKNTPIIIVPAAATSMINMYNVLDFFDNQKFVESRVGLDSGKEKPREISFIHKFSTANQKNVNFKIVDSTQDFRSEDWKNVVCVATAGATWQFTNWHWTSPKDIFENCLGFYPKYRDERLKDSVSGWNVIPINIDRHKRHTDRATIIELWTQIEQFIASKKPWILS